MIYNLLHLDGKLAAIVKLVIAGIFPSIIMILDQGPKTTLFLCLLNSGLNIY